MGFGSRCLTISTSFLPSTPSTFSTPTSANASSSTWPRAPKGKTYEAWVADPSVHAAGLFPGGLVKLTLPVQHGAQVMVTLERSGGVDAPTQQPLLRVRA